MGATSQCSYRGFDLAFKIRTFLWIFLSNIFSTAVCKEYIDTAFRASSKLATEWGSADYDDRQTLQYLVFPEGIYYNRKKDECRTPKYNMGFRYFAGITRGSEENNKGNCNKNLQFPSLVARTGIEPMTFGLWARRATAALPRNEGAKVLL